MCAARGESRHAASFSNTDATARLPMSAILPLEQYPRECLFHRGQ
jgi:hypothetical protein